MKSNQVVIALIAVALFLAGNVSGFFLGVLSVKQGQKLLSDVLSDEQAADVERPRTISRDGLSLKYPSNWAIQKEDEGYDPDFYFSIDSPGSSYVLFTVYPVETEPRANVTEQLEFYRELIISPKESSFDRWGEYEGEGIHVRGRLMGIKGGVRVFSHSSDSASFVVVESYYDEDTPMTKPGFDLVEKTFRLRAGGEPEATE